LANADILERSTGMSLVYLRMSEVIEQVDVGRTTFTSAALADEAEEDRQQRINGYLRLVGVKQKCTDSLIRRQKFQAKPSLQEVAAAARGC
jgi:hypothetical protein